MRIPSLRKISTKVALSFMLIVLLQGALSIIALRYLTNEAMRASLADQAVKTKSLIDSFMSDTKKEMSLKAGLVAGQANLVNTLARREMGTLRYELSFFLAPLKLDALMIVDNEGNEIVRTEILPPGAPSICDLLLKGNPTDLLEEGKSFTTTSTGGTKLEMKSMGNRIQLWSLNEIMVGGKRRAVLCAAQSLDHSFIGRIEDISGASMLLALGDYILVNGRVADNIFIEYSRRVSADPNLGSTGTIKSFIYNTTFLPDYPALKLIYFIDTNPAHNTLAATLGKTLTMTFAVIAATLLIAAATSIFLYRYSFKKPFVAFQEAIRKLSAGDLSFNFSPSTEDEFADLEREFETMTANLRKLERELQIRSRMAAIGEMVAGVAHQIRNPLAVIRVSAEMIRDAAAGRPGGVSDQPSPATRSAGRIQPRSSKAADANIVPLAEMIVSEVDSLGAVISKFLDFTRPLSIKEQEVDVGEFLSRAASHIPMEKYPGRGVCVDVAPGAERARFDRSLMEQAVCNLIANALAASKPGQNVRLRAERCNGTFKILVEDEGEGMSEEVRAQIFHPFFTTKSEGTGLGLSIVHRIVQEHGGTIDVHTGRGGTCFEIKLGGAA